MQNDILRGQSSLLQRLYHAWRSGEIVHAYFISGAPGSGKRTLAQLFSQALLCEEQERPCGACSACRRVMTGNHPDVHVLASEKNSLGVDSVRDFLSDLMVRPYEAGRIVAVIERADTMTPQAQNALLKTLEDPPPSVVFLLLGESVEAMLPTIRSRVAVLRMRPLSVREVEEELLSRGVTETRAGVAAAVSAGSIGEAIRLTQDEAYWEFRQEALDMLFLLLKEGGKKLPVVSAYARDLKKRASDMLNIWLLALRDALCLLEGAEVLQQDWKQRLEDCGSAVSTEACCMMMQSIQKALKQLSGNAQNALVLDVMLMEIWEEITHDNRSGRTV